MSKIKIVIDTESLNDVAQTIRMLQAIEGAPAKGSTETEMEESEEEPAKEEKKPRQKKEKAKPEPVEETTEEQPEQEAETETEETVEEQPEKKETKKTESSVTLDELRTLLSEKVGDHREIIKNKLKELDATSVSTLSEDKYQDFFNFLDFL